MKHYPGFKKQENEHRRWFNRTQQVLRTPGSKADYTRARIAASLECSIRERQTLQQIEVVERNFRAAYERHHGVTLSGGVKPFATNSNEVSNAVKVTILAVDCALNGSVAVQLLDLHPAVSVAISATATLVVFKIGEFCLSELLDNQQRHPHQAQRYLLTAIGVLGGLLGISFILLWILGRLAQPMGSGFELALALTLSSIGVISPLLAAVMAVNQQIKGFGNVHAHVHDALQRRLDSIARLRGEFGLNRLQAVVGEDAA